MSRIKSLTDNFNSSGYINHDNISPNLRLEYNKIINDLQHQLFFDQDLTHEHRMFLLNNRNTIESKFIQVLHDRINNLNIDSDIRERLIGNINKFSENLTHINIYSNTNHHFHVNYNSDEESDIDYQTDNFDSDANDDYDDLENLILDEIEMEHDINVFSDNIQENQDEHGINNNNNNNHPSN